MERHTHVAEDHGCRDLAPPVVVVDDDGAARLLVIRALEKMQLRNPIHVAEDGQGAVELLDALEVGPALVVLDLLLPHRSGLEVLAWTRQHPRLACVPVVVLSGSSELAHVDRAYALGVSAYLVKPVGFGAIQDAVLRLEAPWMLLTSADEG